MTIDYICGTILRKSSKGIAGQKGISVEENTVYHGKKVEVDVSGKVAVYELFEYQYASKIISRFIE